MAFNAAPFLTGTAAGRDLFIGFQSDTLEVAELTPDTFLGLTKISLKSSLIPSVLKSGLSPVQVGELESWNLESKPVPIKKAQPFKAKSLNINVTQICNLKCSYCAAGGDGTYGDPVKRVEIEKTLPQLQEEYLKTCLIL